MKMNRNYRLAPERMTADEALRMLGVELRLWEKTASQFSTPEPKRLRRLYDRYAGEVDQQKGGEIARHVGLFLSNGRAYQAALPFLRLAEAKGQLVPDVLQESEIALVFACELEAGASAKARQWWQVIEQSWYKLTATMQQQKSALDLKLGGSPAGPV